MDYHIEKVASANAEVGEVQFGTQKKKKYIGQILQEENYLNMTLLLDQTKQYIMVYRLVAIDLTKMVD